MKTKRQILARSLVIVVVSLVVGLVAVSAAQATPLLQDPRPPVDDDGGGTGGGNGAGGNGGSGGQPGAPDCAKVSGQVLNWGFGPEPNVGLELKSGSWSVATASASDGSYGFGGLGVGVARLQVLLAPAQAEQLQPWVQDAGIYLTCDFPTIANMALSSGDQVEPPASIEMSGPATVSADSQLPLRLAVKNDLPNQITNVIVTDLMPPGLKALAVQAAAADSERARIIDAGPDGQLVVVFLDKLATGVETNIFITVAAAPDVPTGTQIRNTATLFYAESIADQAQLDFTVGRGLEVAPTTVTSPTLQAEAAPAAVLPAPESAPLPAPTAAAEGEEAFVPPPESAPTTGGELLLPDSAPTAGGDFVPPDLLPTTGDEALPPPALLPETGLGLIIPVSGVGLVAVAFLVHFLRASRRSRE